MVSTIYTDADNTLWDTDAVFRAAQIALLDHVETIAAAKTSASDRLAFVREYDQAIASQHHERLRYPPALLAHALMLALRGTSPTEAAKRVIRDGGLPVTDDAVGRFAGMLKTLPPLLPGVREGIDLAERGGFKIYVVTEGTQERTARNLRDHGLLEHTTQVLSATKSVTLYTRLKILAGSSSVAMIGDQLDRDVLYAREAGLFAVWVPGAFRPKWVDAEASANASFVARDFLAAMTWLLEVGNDRASHEQSLSSTNR